MMQTIVKQATLLGIVIILIFCGCKKNESNEDPTAEPPTLTEQQKEAISSSYNQIAFKADSIILTDNPIDGFQESLLFFKSLPEVENAWVSGEALIVKFRNAGLISWINTHDFIIPPYGLKESQFSTLDRIPVGVSTACLINQVFDDERFTYSLSIVDHIQQSLSINGFSTTIINGANADLDFFQNEFQGYGTYFFLTHGFYDNSRTWMCTGEEVDEPTNILQKLLNDFLEWWRAKKISVGTIRETRAGVAIPIQYYTISDKFVSSEYHVGSFPNSLIYLVACQAFKSTIQLAQAYVDKGAGVVIGWDETHCKGPSTGKLLFDLLLGGATLGSAISDLPDDSKISTCAVESGANLTYFPIAGQDICLVEEKFAEVIISSPLEGMTYSNRILTLSGSLSNVAVLTNGIVELNGIPTTLTKVENTSFSQPIVINNGSNTIKVTCFGILQSGESVTASKTITVIGDLPAIDLFTELRWNTNYSDVDFHLLPPGCDINRLWTVDDCFYNNMTTSWGGYLDVDDVDGYGPEHITIPSVISPGKYRLFVHYYLAHGAGETQAFVDVSVRNGSFHSFGPYNLTYDGGDNAGDVWEICTIDFPSGIITPINQYYYLGKKKSNASKNQ